MSPQLESPALAGVTVPTGPPPAWLDRWSRRSGRRLGSTAEHRPDYTLLVPKAVPMATTSPTILAALGGRADLAVAAVAAEVAECLDGVLVLAHAVPLSFGERSIGLADALDGGRSLLRAAHERAHQHAPALRVVEQLLRMWPHELVGGSVAADLLVLGRPPSIAISYLGLIASSAVHHSPCSVLVVPQDVAASHPR